MAFLPKPVYGTIKVSLMPDGRYGPADPLNWPQLLQTGTKFSWLAVLQRKSRNPEEDCLWRVLTPAEFVRSPLSPTMGFGTVIEDTIRPLMTLVKGMNVMVNAFRDVHGVQRDLVWLSSTMRHAMDRLDLPSTYRDLVRQHAAVQRFYLYTAAWLEWHTKTFEIYPMQWPNYVRLKVDEMMGSISTSPVFVQRCAEVGVPVWYFRHREQVLASTEGIFESERYFATPVERLPIPEPTVLTLLEKELAGKNTFTTLAGDRHIQWINHNSFRYGDIEDRPMPKTIVPVSAFGSDAGPSHAQIFSSASTSSSSTTSGVVRSVVNTKGKETRHSPCKLLPSLFIP